MCIYSKIHLHTAAFNVAVCYIVLFFIQSVATSQTHSYLPPDMKWSHYENVVDSSLRSSFHYRVIVPLKDSGYIFAGILNYGASEIIRKDINGNTVWSQVYLSDSPSYRQYIHYIGYQDDDSSFMLVGKHTYGPFSTDGDFVRFKYNIATGEILDTLAKPESYIEGGPTSINSFIRTSKDEYITGGKIVAGLSDIKNNSAMNRIRSDGTILIQKKYSRESDIEHKVSAIAEYDENTILLGSYRNFRDTDGYLKQSLYVRAVDTNGDELWRTPVEFSERYMYAQQLLKTRTGRVFLLASVSFNEVESSYMQIFEVIPQSRTVTKISTISYNEESYCPRMVELSNGWLVLAGETGNFLSNSALDLSSYSNLLVIADSNGVVRKSYEWGVDGVYDGLLDIAVADENSVIVAGTAERNLPDSISNESQYYALLDLSKLTANDMITHHNLTITPNPASDLLTVELPVQQHNNSDIYVYNILGQEMLRIKTNVNVTNFQIDLASLPNGVYIIKIGIYKSSFIKR